MQKIEERPAMSQFAGVLAVTGLIFLILTATAAAREGRFEDSVTLLGVTVSMLFMFAIPMIYVVMATVGMTKSKWIDVTTGKNKLLKESLAFLVGFSIWYGFLSLTSAFSNTQTIILPVSIVFSSVGGIVNPFWDMFINTITAPICEELLFTSALPLFIAFLLRSVGDALDWSLLKMDLVFIGVSIAVAAPIFAFFHLGMTALTYFVISSIIFRTLMISVVWGDKRFNFLPFVEAYLIFAIGVHMANNIHATGGLMNWFMVVINQGLLSFEPISMIVSLMILAFFGIPILIIGFNTRKVIKGEAS